MHGHNVETQEGKMTAYSPPVSCAVVTLLLVGCAITTLAAPMANADPAKPQITILYDAFGKEHIVQDKAPIVTEKPLDPNSKYPQDGIIACEIVKEWKDTNGRTIFTVDTAKPWVLKRLTGRHSLT